MELIGLVQHDQICLLHLLSEDVPRARVKAATRLPAKDVAQTEGIDQNRKGCKLELSKEPVFDGLQHCRRKIRATADRLTQDNVRIRAGDEVVGSPDEIIEFA